MLLNGVQDSPPDMHSPYYAALKIVASALILAVSRALASLL